MYVSCGLVWPAVSSGGLLWAPVASCGLLWPPEGSCGLLWAPVASYDLLWARGPPVGSCGLLENDIFLQVLQRSRQFLKIPAARTTIPKNSCSENDNS